MTKEEFYTKCAEILKVNHNYIELKPLTKYNRITGETIQTNSPYCRWGPRKPGNGRFPGFGLIRVFSPQNIFVTFNHPKSVSKTFNSFEEVLDFLEKLVDGD